MGTAHVGLVRPNSQQHTCRKPRRATVPAHPGLVAVTLLIGIASYSRDTSAVQAGPAPKAADRQPPTSEALVAAKKRLRTSAEDHRQKREYRLALIDLQECLALDQNDPDSLNDVAWYKATSPDRQAGDGVIALMLASKACTLTKFGDPLHIDTLAAANAAKGDFDMAIQCERAAILACRKNAELPERTISRFLNSARLYLQLYEAKQAVNLGEDPERVIRDLPYNREEGSDKDRLLLVHVRRASKHLDRGDRASALEELTVGLLLYPDGGDSYIAYSLSAALRAARGDYADAIDDCTAAISLEKTSRAAIDGSILFRTEAQRAKARADLRTDLGGVFFTRAFARLASKQYDLALSDLTTAQSYKPSLAASCATARRVVEQSQVSFSPAKLATVAAIAFGAYAILSAADRPAAGGARGRETEAAQAPVRPPVRMVWKLGSCSNCNGRGRTWSDELLGNKNTKCSRCGGSGLHDEWHAE